MPGPISDPRTWTGTSVAGAAGEPLGQVAAIYSDNVTGEAEWAAVAGGNGHTALVPLREARHDGGMVHVPYSSGQLQTAPHHDPAAQFSYEDGAQLYQHYGLAPVPRPAQGQAAATAYPAGAGEPGAPAAAGAPLVGQDRAGTDDATVVRWEEQLRVGPHTETVVTGRLRLRKFAVTEEQTFTVPVTREEVTIDYEDVPGGEHTAGTGGAGAGLTEETYEVVRYEERVLITKELVPVERIRLVKRVVTADEVVTGQVRREVVETSVDRFDDALGQRAPEDLGNR